MRRFSNRWASIFTKKDNGKRETVVATTTIIYMVHCQLGSLREADWQGPLPNSHPLTLEDERAGDRTKPGRVHTPMGHDSVPLGPPVTLRASTVQPRTSRYLVSMSGHEETLQMSWELAGEDYAQLGCHTMLHITMNMKHVCVFMCTYKKYEKC